MALITALRDTTRLRLGASFVLALLALTGGLSSASAQRPSHPQIGAQIWIEPGQTPDEIDRWFAVLESSHMPVARLFLMWNYIEPERDRWDFTLYDAAFRAAERHNVRVVATLTPNFGPTH